MNRYTVIIIMLLVLLGTMSGLAYAAGKDVLTNSEGKQYRIDSGEPVDLKSGKIIRQKEFENNNVKEEIIKQEIENIKKDVIPVLDKNSPVEDKVVAYMAKRNMSSLALEFGDMKCVNVGLEQQTCSFKVYLENITDTTLSFSALNNATLIEILEARDTLELEHKKRVENYITQQAMKEYAEEVLVDETYVVEVK